MNTQLTERIKKNRAGFSKGQRLIAQYIEDNPDWVAFMTAAKLGATVGVSESTVVRFATEIGYAGYPELQQAIQEMIRNKLKSFQRLDMTSRNFELHQLLDTVFDQDVGIIRRTKQSIDHAEFYKAVEALVTKKKVYILGAGSSLAIATFLAHYFELIFESVRLVDATSEARIYQQMIRAGKDDAVVVISFPRYSRKAVNALQYASNIGAATIAITDSESSPLAKYAGYKLYARSDMVSFVDSLVGALSLINALIVTLAIEKKNEVSETLKKIEGIWDDYGVYEKVDEQDIANES